MEVQDQNMEVKKEMATI